MDERGAWTRRGRPKARRLNLPAPEGRWNEIGWSYAELPGPERVAGTVCCL